jgi:hypothetical protein
MLKKHCTDIMYNYNCIEICALTKHSFETKHHVCIKKTKVIVIVDYYIILQQNVSLT